MESSDLPGAEDAYRRSHELLQRAWAPDGARLAVERAWPQVSPQLLDWWQQSDD